MNRRDVFVGVALLVAILLTLPAGFLAIPPITFDTFARHFPALSGASGRFVISIFAFGPAFIAGAGATVLLAIRVARTSRLVAAVVSAPVPVILFPSTQWLLIAALEAVTGPILVGASGYVLVAAVAGIAFGVSIAIGAALLLPSSQVAAT